MALYYDLPVFKEVYQLILKIFDKNLVDGEMRDMTGFESYSHYAIKAIRFNALDYLVKPIDLGELKIAIKRYKENRKGISQHENLKLALHNIRTKNVADHKLILQTQEGELRLIINDIIRIEGEGNYSYIFLKNDKKKLVLKTLLNLEELLEDKGFYRCHRSHVINGDHTVGYLKGESSYLFKAII